MYKTDAAVSSVTPFERGFVLNQEAPANERHLEGHLAVWTDDARTTVDHCWFRGGWFDPLTMAWNNVMRGELISNEPGPGAPGGSLYVPVELAPGESKTVRLYMAWFVPRSNHRIGPDPKNVRDFGSCYNEADYAGQPDRYEPWYSRRFRNVNEVAAYWEENYDQLKQRTGRFTEAFYDTSLPKEVVEAVAANLTILKSPTVMRQHDGRFWVWEGSGDSWGSCHGSCTHVWNYAQAVPHLFPAWSVRCVRPSFSWIRIPTGIRHFGPICRFGRCTMTSMRRRMGSSVESSKCTGIGGSAATACGSAGCIRS